MYEHVTVSKVTGPDRVEVACSSSACAGCKGSMFCNAKGKKFEALNEKQLDLQVGQSVEIYLKPSRTIMSTIITLIFPLALFPVGYYGGQLAGLSEILSMLCSFAGVGIGLLLAGLYFRLKQNHYLPVVEKAFEQEQV